MPNNIPWATDWGLETVNHSPALHFVPFNRGHLPKYRDSLHLRMTKTWTRISIKMQKNMKDSYSPPNR